MSNENNMFKRIPPFKWFVLQNFPFIEEDFDAITNYQLLCKIVEYLNLTIGKTNELGTQVENLTNWFNNLDVQDEINNKLDEMAEDGTLAEIINEQIFGELNDRVTQNEGDISSLQEDVTTLQGTVGQNVEDIQEMQGDITDLQTNVNRLDKNIIVAIGDSWTANTNQNAIWKTVLANALNYEVKNYSQSGTGFITGTNTFISQAQTAVNDTTLDKNKVAFVVVIGGVNDVIYGNATFSTLISPIQTLFQYLEDQFHTQIIFVPNYKYPFNRQLTLWSDVEKFINYTSLVKMCNIVPLQNYAHFDSTDWFHLTQDGQRFFAGNLVKCMFGGQLSSFVYNESFRISNKIYCNVLQYIEGQIVHVSLYGYFYNTENIIYDSYAMEHDLPCKFIDSHVLYSAIADNIERSVKPYIEFKLENNNYLTFGYIGNDVSADERYDFHIDFEYHVDNIQLDS